MTAAAAKILILDGEGIGPEIMAEVRRVLDWFDRKRNLRFEIQDELYGSAAYARHGKVISDQALTAMRQADAILFGATGGPAFERIPAPVRREGTLLRIRKTLDLYANLRPVFAIKALEQASALKPRVLQGVDLVIVRELTGGMYFGEPRGVTTLPDGSRVGINTHRYTSGEIQRIAQVAFELARTRSRRVCSVDKSNVMEAGALWREEVTRLRDANYPDIELRHMLADNCAMQLVRAPAQFDVILTDNLFGDLLSDGAAMIMGSLGMLPSASLGAVQADGRRPALYEPVHGSAPDIAGQGIANPLGAILSLALAFRLSLGLPAEAVRLERAVTAALDDGARTADIALAGESTVSTAAMGAAVLAALDNLAP